MLSFDISSLTALYTRNRVDIETSIWVVKIVQPEARSKKDLPETLDKPGGIGLFFAIPGSSGSNYL